MQTTSNYRASAEECQRLARSAASEEEREFLKELAETWLGLAERSHRIAQIGLDAVENALVPIESNRRLDHSHSETNPNPFSALRRVMLELFPSRYRRCCGMRAGGVGCALKRLKVINSFRRIEAFFARNVARSMLNRFGGTFSSRQ
jgi:hypothetical protein